MKIMIAYPPLQGEGTPLLGQNRQFQWFHNPTFLYPIVPASAATLLKHAGHEVLWSDGLAERWSFEQFMAHVLEVRPQLVAMETKSPVVKQHWGIIARLKAELPETRLVLMGDHVTAFPEESLRASPVDFVLTGGYFDFQLQGLVETLEGRGALPSGIWHRRQGEIESSGGFAQDYDLDSLPLIDRDLTKWFNYGEKFYKRAPFIRTMVGRDCAKNACTFCSWTTLFPKFRSRSPKSLLDEIEMLVSRYGVREVFDDTGTFPAGGWLRTFCEGLIEKGLHREILFDLNFRFDLLTPRNAELMKRAGFRLMKIGLESANQATLDRLKKGITLEQIWEGCRIAKAAGLDLHLTTMVGYPWETRQDAERTLALARQLMAEGYAEMLQATVVMPYPGTPLFRDAVEHGWLRIGPTEYERLDMREPVFITPDMTPDEVMAMCRGLYRGFLDVRFLARKLSKVRTFDDVRYLLRGVKPVVGHLLDFKGLRARAAA